ncbi:MAG: response regulator [Bacteroidetes bacterium]|nr:response regulator [Bacteroidota bacterium]MBI3483338.1 response regulator [Bacteroidota bacterium]
MEDKNTSLLVDDVKEIDFESAETYQILFLEDSPDDVELMEHELKEAGMQFISRRVDNKNQFIKEVVDFQPDIVLADYSLTMFNGMQAFRMLKEENLIVPFILVTGVLSEKLALDCLKEGVDDFILKSSFKRLPAAIISAIRKKEMEEEKNRFAAELKKSHEELRLLVNRHQISIEEERMNIARDLHDELGQVLTALKIDIAMLRKRLTSGKRLSEQTINEEFGSISKTVDKIAMSAKEISSGLRPEALDDLGILEAIQWQTIEFEKRNKISCQLYLPNEHLELTKELSIALFRIVQETLTNVARHSLASLVQIYLDIRDGVLFLEILDNGKGIEDDKIRSSKSLGIIGLRERVQLLRGQFFIGKAKGGGTKVSIMIPTNK